MRLNRLDSQLYCAEFALCACVCTSQAMPHHMGTEVYMTCVTLGVCNVAHIIKLVNHGALDMPCREGIVKRRVCIVMHYARTMSLVRVGVKGM